MLKKYKITGFNCPACAALLESDLEDIGVKCSCSYAKSELEAEISGEIQEVKIVEVIQKSGFQITF